MTTDTRPKEAVAQFVGFGVPQIVGGMAKGAGMIHPDMATLLAFVTTVLVTCTLYFFGPYRRQRWRYVWPGAVLRGQLERQARGQTIFTFGGGTNEVQRDLIAIFGLGMPRSLR